MFLPKRENAPFTSGLHVPYHLFQRAPFWLKETGSLKKNQDGRHRTLKSPERTRFGFTFSSMTSVILRRNTKNKKC